jgi:hypothetical protein
MVNASFLLKLAGLSALLVSVSSSALGEAAAADSDRTDSPPSVEREARAALAEVRVTGSSPTFSFEEAIQDALAQAERALPRRHPDLPVTIEIKTITARRGGNILPGLTIEATAR